MLMLAVQIFLSNVFLLICKMIIHSFFFHFKSVDMINHPVVKDDTEQIILTFWTWAVIYTENIKVSICVRYICYTKSSTHTDIYSVHTSASNFEAMICFVCAQALVMDGWNYDISG